MLRFFQSIFRSDTTAGKHPESLVKAAIERAVDSTDPWIRAVSGYKKKLRPSVIKAMDHVVTLADGMAPAIVVKPGSYDTDPKLRTFFISKADMRKILGNDRNLAEFRRKKAGPTSLISAMLAMELKESVFTGAALSGDIVLHDVPQVAVSFEAHRLYNPASSENETRRQLKIRAYDHLLSLALRRITIIKTEREKLEKYRMLLQAKLNLLQRGGWGFDEVLGDERLDVKEVEKQLARIESDLLEIGGDDHMLEVYLGVVLDVLGRPEEHLWFSKETLIIDQMGIKRRKTAGDTREVTLDVINNSEGRSLVVSLITLSGETI